MQVSGVVRTGCHGLDVWLLGEGTCKLEALATPVQPQSSASTADCHSPQPLQPTARASSSPLSHTLSRSLSLTFSLSHFVARTLPLIYTSIPSVPRSTKSPLNMTRFESDGSPISSKMQFRSARLKPNDGSALAVWLAVSRSVSLWFCVSVCCSLLARCSCRVAVVEPAVQVSNDREVGIGRRWLDEHNIVFFSEKLDGFLHHDRSVLGSKRCAICETLSQ